VIINFKVLSGSKPRLTFILHAARNAAACIVLFCALLDPQVKAQAPVASDLDSACDSSERGSPYIPVDSWIYPAVLRLYSMGYVDGIYLGMRPWTRANLAHILEEVEGNISDANDFGVQTVDEARRLYTALTRETTLNPVTRCLNPNRVLQPESVYSTFRALSGTPLRDSYHLGQTIVNDYGRTYGHGFNSYIGASGYASSGRYTFYLRGEMQSSASFSGYSQILSETLSDIDNITFIDPTTGLPHNQATIPMGILPGTTKAKVIEAYASARVLNHNVSFGKQDAWLGPGIGSGMAYSNNAENLYSFRIDRIEPLIVPGLSKFTGAFRYDFLVGPLQGHTYPNSPYLHLEKISFRPSENLEVGFERTVIWGGKDHVPITLHTFLRSFFSLSAPVSAIKHSSQDPGARFAAFDFSYRLPFLRHWLTLYSDSEVHDDVSPIDAPRRACWRPGIYLSHFPALPRLDLRVEAVSSDPPISTSHDGALMYYETVQRQGYSNKGMLLGDWIGREAKGGEAWITYHLGGNEWIQASARNQKIAKDFIPGGTTLNDFRIQFVKRLGSNFEGSFEFIHEDWKAPIYMSGRQTSTVTTVRLTWFPSLSPSSR
jgi:hypothetical protein